MRKSSNQPKGGFLYCQILTSISHSFVRRRTENVFVRMAPSSAEKISNARISMARLFFQRGAKSWECVNFNGLKIYRHGSYFCWYPFKLLFLLLMQMKLSDLSLSVCNSRSFGTGFSLFLKAQNLRFFINTFQEISSKKVHKCPAKHRMELYAIMSNRLVKGLRKNPPKPLSS